MLFDVEGGFNTSICTGEHILSRQMFRVNCFPVDGIQVQSTATAVAVTTSTAGILKLCEPNQIHEIRVSHSRWCRR